MSRVLSIREFILLNRRCLHTGGSITSGPSKAHQPPHPKTKLTYQHTQDTLQAIRSLVSEKSDVSNKVKKLLGTDDSWVRLAKSKQPRPKKTKREREAGPVPSSSNVTLPSTKLLQPYEVSQVVQQLAREGKLDEAAKYLSNLPLDALNVQAWNTLLWEANKAKRYKVAWEIFNQMKKKGFEPSSNSYKTMLFGIARIDDFQAHTLALERAHKLYAGFIKYTDSLKKEAPDHPELFPTPIQLYMTILAKTGLRNQMWDTFYAMDKEGPMAPNAFTFANILQYLDWRAINDPTPLEEWNYRVASDAALIWRLMLSSERKNKFQIDSHALAAVIRHLSKGKVAEKELGFEISRSYLGLQFSDSPQEKSESESSSIRASDSLTPFTLQSALELCQAAKRPDLVIDFMKQAMKVSEEKSVVDIHHMGILFNTYYDTARAEGSLPSAGSSTSTRLSPSKQALESLKWLLSRAATFFVIDRSKEERERHLWPTLRTYNLILATCRECKDWESAKKILEMMTGIRFRTAGDESNPAEASDTNGLPPISSLTKRYSYQSRQYFRPTAETLFDIMHCAQGYAVKHDKPETAHECLSVISILGGAELLKEHYMSSRKVLHDIQEHPHPKDKVASLDKIVKREEERKKYWAIRAAAIIPALFSLATRKGGWSRKEYEKAVIIRDAATEILNEQRHDMANKEKEEKARRTVVES